MRKENGQEGRAERERGKFDGCGMRDDFERVSEGGEREMEFDDYGMRDTGDIHARRERVGNRVGLFQFLVL